MFAWGSNEKEDHQHHKNQTLSQFAVGKIKQKWSRVKKIAECVKKYNVRATATGDKYVHVTNTSFPVMTICPTYPYKLNRLNFHGIKTKSDIQFEAAFVSNRSEVTPTQFYEDVVYAKEEIIDAIEIFSEAEIGGLNKFILSPNDTICEESIFKTKQYYYNGDCFALNLPTCLKLAGILEIIITFFNKTDIFIHHDGQFLSPNSRSRIDVDVTHFVKIAINHEVVQMLSAKGTCVDQYGEGEGVDSDMDNSFDGCMYSKLRELMMSEVGCTVPWLPDKRNICTLEQDRKMVFDIYQKNRRNQEDLCPSSCKFTNMYFGPPVTGLRNIEDQDRGSAVFYFRRDIKTTNEYYLYSITSMFAEIGGYVGLLLGVSLFKLADINNSVLDWVMENRVYEVSDKNSER